jgi:hypothetical protein
MADARRSGTPLKVLLTERHLQRYETFRTEYERVATQLAPELRYTAPSRAQYYRWLTGQLKGGTPYPDACRVLEGMFPPWSADDLFGPPLPADGAAIDGLLASVPQSFPTDVLEGVWVTSYTFSQPPKLHVDIAHITVEGAGRSGPGTSRRSRGPRATGWPTATRSTPSSPTAT